jgi:hypothetical protein
LRKANRTSPSGMPWRMKPRSRGAICEANSTASGVK